MQLPSISANWDISKDCIFHKKLAKVINKPVEAAGHAFMSRVRRSLNKRSLAEDYELTKSLNDAAGADDDEEIDEPETKKLLSLNPANWKKQDHYAVLGLSKKRYLATDDEIKKAYRKKVLKHHPDKKAHLGAWEILTDSKKRMQFDSCDPTFDPSIPDPKADGNFFELYGPPGAPDLGDEKSSREHVENFYQFWFAFDSWRTFEYLDEEDTDKSGSREEKRWLDKKNIASRKKNKKEDIQRLNRLIEQAFALDPRIKEFKAQDKYEKDAKKREKEAAAKAEAEAAANAAEIARIKEEKEAELAKEASKKAKEEKESAKNAIKKERKTIRRIMRDSNNFLPKDSSAEHILVHTEKIEFILASGDVGYLEQVRLKFESVMNFGVEHLELVLEDEHHFLNTFSNSMSEQSTEMSRKEFDASHGQHPAWSAKEESALKKGMAQYPSGTIDRWHNISQFVSQNTGIDRSVHACIHHAKKILPKSAIPSKPTVTSATNAGKSSENGESATSGNGVGIPKMTIPEKSDWSIEQQLQLEAALVKFPAAGFKKQDKRWEKIAMEIVGKDKTQVKSRMKELSELQKRSSKK